MEDLSDIDDFEGWSLKDKFYLFDEMISDLVNKLNQKEIQRFLKDVILNANENSYIRKKALENFLNLVRLHQIKKRYALNLLIDDWIESNDIFVELIRIKNLLLFYEDDSEEIEEIFRNLSHHNENEVKSESLLQLGLISLFKANVMEDKSHYIDCLNSSVEYLVSATGCIENRIDAKFFLYIVTILLDTIQGNHGGFEQNFKRVAELLWEQRIFALDEDIPVFQVGLFRTLYSFKKIKGMNPNDWLDYRKEFNKMCFYFYEMKNQEIKNQLTQSELLNSVSDNLIRRTLEPLFAINFSAELCRIEKRLNELDSNSKEHEFLLYLKRIASESNFKEHAEKDLIISKLLNVYPHIEKTRIERELGTIKDIHNLQSIFYLFELFSEFSNENLFDALISSCVNLQGNKLYWNASENQRNTFIASSLEMAGFPNKDQTLWGESRAGKEAGEIDIFVKQKSGKPFSIIEALNLNSLSKEYLNLHLEKIFKYDTTGLKFNYILVYSLANNFGEFWSKYTNYIQQYNFPFPKEEYEEISELDYTDIRACKTTHIRNGKKVYLYHIIVNLHR
ncbi:hypothetical protein P9265_22565 [Schinkia azotoformans]|uniref:hypothetical protein n=1 Tax=Schinkia azotoformans TaxID=1454 RepID=UPI002E20FDE9|nr:hypothetical protein [Schinkia azotoformans]